MKNEELKKQMETSLTRYILAEKETRGIIEEILKVEFGIETENNDNVIFFNIGSDEYQITLDRGWILLEDANNDNMENKYWLDTVEGLIDILDELTDDYIRMWD